MADQKPRIDDVDDHQDVIVALTLALPGYLFKRILKAPYKETTGESVEDDSLADAIRWYCRDAFADGDSETFQKSKPGYVEGVDRPRYADYNDRAAYERAKDRWKAMMHGLGFDPNDMPLFSEDD